MEDGGRDGKFFGEPHLWQVSELQQSTYRLTPTLRFLGKIHGLDFTRATGYCKPMNTSEKPSPLQSALLDFPQTQLYLGGLSRSTLKLLVARGDLAPTRIGRRVLFRRESLDQFISEASRK
jgi:excisionase family DNA binding protein